MTEEQMLTKKERRELRKEEKNEMRNSFERKKTIKRLMMWILLGGALAGSVFAIYNSGNSPQTTAMLVDAVSSSDRISGLADSKVVLIEYGDFQCPACAQYEPLVRQVRENYVYKIAFVYRHFPLSQHKNAKITAYASEAAGKQGKFWEMHDKIYDGQREWSNLSNDKTKEILIGYAKSIGLDLELFAKDIDSKDIKDKVESDTNSGVKAGVNSTPTFILNGKRIQPRSYDEFKELIDKELSSNS